MSETKKWVPVKKNNNEKGTRQERLEKVIESIVSLVDDRFTGYLRINFSQGKIGRVEKFEEILKNPRK